MGKKGKRSWRRAFNRYIGLGTAVLGLLIVFSSFRLLDNLFLWYVTIMVGLFVVLSGFLYGAYPFLTNERRYTMLRKEVNQFIGLVRQLNEAATNESQADMESAKAAMRESVERMSEMAGKEG